MNIRKILFILVLLGILSMPYFVGFGADAGHNDFVGFLINPIDGNSYLAKMQIGLRGDWRFQLPYTAEPGKGAYLFLFYIFLGHLCKWSGLAPITVFHLARALSGGILFFALDYFFRIFFAEESPELAQKSFYLAGIGSGLGWAASFLGMLTPDLWVPEAYPFFSAYATPHFSLGMALLLLIFTLSLQNGNMYQFITMTIAGVLLAIIMPFGMVIVALVLGIQWVWRMLESRKFIWQPQIFSLLLGGVLLLYQYWATVTDPVLAGWNKQNITPAPPVWEFIIGFSPALVPAIWTIRDQWRAGAGEKNKLLVIWVLVGAGLIYFPFSLQRRFMFALFVPVAGLAVQGLMSLLVDKKIRQRLWLVLLILSLPTNVFILLAGLFGVQTQNPKLYLTGDEKAALDWVSQNTEEDALILSSPEMGLFIPAQTGRRVLYGHPFETVDAEAEKGFVESFYSDRFDSIQEEKFIDELGIDYVFYGPREADLGHFDELDDLVPVFNQGEVTLFAVGVQ